MNNDYDRVCKELLDRIDKAFSQGHQFVSMTLIYWAAIFAAIFGALANDKWFEFICFSWVFPLIIFLLSFLLLLPVLLILPYAIKFNDHMRSITSCVAYIRVFYELPNILHKPNATICASWETVHVNFKIPHAKKIASEYRIISILSLFLSVATLVVGNVVYLQNGNNNIIFLLILVVLMFGLYPLFLIKYILPIYKHTDTATFFGDYAETFLDEYLKRAKYLGLITDNDTVAYKQYCKHFNESDQQLDNDDKLNGKKKAK